MAQIPVGMIGPPGQSAAYRARHAAHTNQRLDEFGQMQTEGGVGVHAGRAGRGRQAAQGQENFLDVLARQIAAGPAHPIADLRSQILQPNEYLEGPEGPFRAGPAFAPPSLQAYSLIVPHPCELYWYERFHTLTL